MSQKKEQKPKDWREVRRLRAWELREEGWSHAAIAKALLDDGATAHGFRGGVWTRKRVRWLIKKHFRVEYTPQHVGRVLRKMGWSRQKPVKRACQRNDEAIEQWRIEKWPQIKKKRKTSNEP